MSGKDNCTHTYIGARGLEHTIRVSFFAIDTDGDVTCSSSLVDGACWQCNTGLSAHEIKQFAATYPTIEWEHGESPRSMGDPHEWIAALFSADTLRVYRSETAYSIAQLLDSDELGDLVGKLQALQYQKAVEFKVDE